jgi:hypothetical protein
MRLLRRRSGRRLADLITATIGQDKDRWSIGWTGDGQLPPNATAAAVTEAVDRAVSMVAELYAQGRPLPGAELQLAIFPWDYTGGAIFDIAGGPGHFTGHDIQGSERTVEAATLEELITTVEQIAEVGHASMFRWIRPIESLSAVGQQ